MIKKVKKKHRAILIMVFIAILLAIYFRPRTLWDTLGLEDVEPNGTTYCSFYDISQLNNEYWSGTVYELLGKSNELFGLLLHEVSISGPVFYKNAVINPDLVNLYLTLPKEDGSYQRRTVELILSYGYTSDTYSAFINIDNKGYFVTSGKSFIASFIQKVRETEEVKVVDLDTKNKTTTVKREDLGEFTPIRQMESENISAENELIKITVTDCILYKLKPNDEYKEFYKNIGIINLDEVPILDIIFKFENLSNEMLEFDSLQGKLTTNTGEELSVILDLFEESDRNKLEFSAREVKDGSVSAILNSEAKEIESIKLIYDDSIILELDLK